jgi:hypothetical protein
MRTFEVHGIEIEAEPSRVFAFVSDPRNLPRWARAFRAADQARAQLETPRGAIDIALRTLPCREAGSVDWEFQFPYGTIGLAQSRVTPTARGTSIYSFVLHAPPVPLEQLEGALAEQSVTLREELATLKALMESR